MDFIDLIPAARSLLNWSQTDLGQQCDLNQATIANIENRRSVPQQSSLARIRAALERGGVEFLPDGVRRPEAAFVPLSGENWFTELLEDVYLTLKDQEGAELLIFGGNNRISEQRPEVVSAFRKIRAAGIGMREMVEEDDLYLMGPEDEYRWIPAAHYHNYVTVIYGDKVCNDFGENAVLLINAEWAHAERSKFEYFWSTARKVKGKSIASTRY